MCSAPKYNPPPPPPMAPPTLDQLAPKSASSGGESKTRKRAKGLSQYKIQETGKSKTKTGSLGGIPTKTGANK